MLRSFFIVATLVPVAFTTHASPDGEGKRRHGPPPAAFEACANQSEGAACSFTGRRDEAVEGTCFAPPRESSALACKPERGPDRRRGHAPEEAEAEE